MVTISRPLLIFWKWAVAEDLMLIITKEFCFGQTVITKLQ